jgi:uncharacterized protein YbbK (DUF523 family)
VVPLRASDPASVEAMEETPAGQEVLPATCRLCEASLPPETERCPSCGMHQVTQLSPSTRWRLGAGVAAVYLMTVLILVLFR